MWGIQRGAALSGQRPRCGLRRVMDTGQCPLGFHVEHDGLGVIHDAADGDGDGGSVGEHRRGCGDHLLELVAGEPVGWPGQLRSHVQSFQRRHVQPWEPG
jgi:hypothetical protein